MKLEDGFETFEEVPFTEQPQVQTAGEVYLPIWYAPFIGLGAMILMGGYILLVKK